MSLKVLEVQQGESSEMSGIEKRMFEFARNLSASGDVLRDRSSIRATEGRDVRKEIRRRAMLLGVAIGTALALLASGVARAQDVTEEFHQQYPVSANGSITVKNLNGWIHIAAWDQDQVKVDAVKRARTKQRLDEAKIDVQHDANSVYIETRYPDRNWHGCDGYGYGYGYGSGGDATNVSYSVSKSVNAAISGTVPGPVYVTMDAADDDDCHNPLANVDYTITVPRNARLDRINPVNGSVEISGVKGPVHVEAVNGRVTVSGIAAEADLSSVNGTVEATFDRIAGWARVHAVNGRVQVTMPSDASVRVRAHSLNGAIDNDFGLPESRGRFIGHDLDGKLGDGTGSLEVNTVNGHVEIRHANDGKKMSSATSMLPKERTLAPY